jgi:hypothetical protein
VSEIVLRRLIPAPVACLIASMMSAVCCFAVTSGWAQAIGDEAELQRLQVKAEDAIASDDPEGAAMAMGRAALMAKRLSVVNGNEARSARLYSGAESLFRSQEHGYRAMALFRRAGGQLPASSGVCGSLALAQGSVQHALADFAGAGPPPDALLGQAKRWRETAEDWVTVVAAMITDYQCP